jgi:hypothetical protein
VLPGLGLGRGFVLGRAGGFGRRGAVLAAGLAAGLAVGFAVGRGAVVVVALFAERDEELVTDGTGAGVAVTAAWAGAGALLSVVEAALHPATRAALVSAAATSFRRSPAVPPARSRCPVLVAPALVAVMRVSLDRPPARAGLARRFFAAVIGPRQPAEASLTQV